MKKNLLFIGMGFLLIGASIISSCTKEGPMGKAGIDGTNGKDGKDGTASCIQCHAPAVVELVATEYSLSKHNYGEAAFEEGGNTGCTPCHASEAFLYVVKNNVAVEFVKNATTSRYTNPYATIATASIGAISCVTCHSSLHTTYTTADLPALTTVAPVKMTMWGGAQTINLPADGGISNLCAKCHQPRPFTNSATNGNVLNYDSLKNFPTAVFYDAARTSGVNVLKPGYRTHTHYGTAGAIYAGKGGVEFGSGYANSAHTSAASCQDCHMAEQTNRVGGHTFRVRAEGALSSSSTWNFKGCNVEGCHKNAPLDANSPKFKDTRSSVKAKLDALAAKLQIGGVDILNRNGNTNEADGGVNLWAGVTTNNYDGYLNIYDPITNPLMEKYNAKSFQYIGTPPSSWSQAQKDYNATLPKITLTNAQMGAIINFQLCLREYSLGIHNTTYTKVLLDNSIAALGSK
jgi:hypothetical protein